MKATMIRLCSTNQGQKVLKYTGIGLALLALLAAGSPTALAEGPLPGW